ncbi:DUF3040 domain-containing protein [Blastococcus sp. PRF04-17]|uniref:DUF3040 domain-containing protein n=1 Tax=Blastococcus sp. PRF04-17 TaxID=2933797 RepID=UPI001FF21F9B|nr:DUF3040 domain-containing protein [Blastococcus sp. PRF04-17]UOY00656.1 DUF3040 domain-containing protein [Blastococcus sp. PRF04-17]
MDDDPVLRSLSADVEREDPELAALLSGGAPFDRPVSRPARPRAHSGAIRLFVVVASVAVLGATLLLPARVVLAAAAMLLILASPLAVCWLLENDDGQATPRHP